MSTRPKAVVKSSVGSESKSDRVIATKLAPIHPGEVLAEDFMAAHELTADQLALDLHAPAKRLSELIRGRCSISADTALRLARYFGTTPALWLNLQSSYDLEYAKDSVGAKIEREVAVRPA